MSRINGNELLVSIAWRNTEGMARVIETTSIATCDICGVESKAFGLWREFTLVLKCKNVDKSTDYHVCSDCYPRPKHYDDQTEKLGNVFQRMFAKLEPTRAKDE
jgi:hypothetical protein